MTRTPVALGRGATVNQRLLNAWLRRSVYLQAWASGVSKQGAALLRREVLPQVLSELTAILSKAKGTVPLLVLQRQAEFAAIMAKIEDRYKLGVGQVGEKLASQLVELAGDEAEWAASSLTKAMPKQIAVLVDVRRAAPSVVNQLATGEPIMGMKLDKWFSNVARSTSEAVERSVRVTMAQGGSLTDVVRMARAAHNVADRGLETVARTAMKQVSSRVREETVEANDDIVEAEQFVATLDGRTSQQCMALDGSKHKPGKGPHPPVHPNCRSERIPVLKSWEDLGIQDPRLQEVPLSTRASMNGEVPETETYGPWLLQQDERFQNDVLGRGKAELLRRGKVPIERFISDDLRPLTLAELRAIEQRS